MKLMKCENGHFFDNDKYAYCPFCGKADVRVTDPLNRTEEPAPKFPGWDTGDREKTVASYTEMSDTESDFTETVFTGTDFTETAFPEPEPDRAEPVSPVSEKNPEEEPEPAASGQEEYTWREPAEPKREEAVWRPAASDNRTISFYERTIGTEPVVGWLVAIEGPYFGEDFKLKSGRNFIGRSPEMDIQLGMDMTVSRRRHAVIIFEPRGKVFIAQPGDSRELFYINDEVVLGNVQLKPFDVLQLGETKLLFMPLCGKEFSWDGLKKDGASEK